MAYHARGLAEGLCFISSDADRRLAQDDEMAEKACRKKGIQAGAVLSGNALCLAFDWAVAWRCLEIYSWHGAVVLAVYHAGKGVGTFFLQINEAGRNPYRQFWLAPVPVPAGISSGIFREYVFQAGRNQQHAFGSQKRICRI